MRDEKRAPRSRFGNPSGHPFGKRRSTPRQHHCCFLRSWYCLVVSGVGGFLVLSVVLFGFFWSNSRVVRLHKGQPGGCVTDADCARCCQSDISPLSACLEPLTNQSYKCEDSCCVVNATPKPDFTTCDDGDYCTVSNYCVLGECQGVDRECHDADWCTVETCSTEERGCVRPLDESSGFCENDCDSNEDCRSGLECVFGRCARFSDGNGSLIFLQHELLDCPDSPPGWYYMRQHYAVVEAAYHDPQSNLRYRVVDHADQIVLPFKDDSVKKTDPEGIALSHVQQHPQTHVVQSEHGGAHTEITLTLNTECQHLEEAASCLSMFANRRYSWVVRMRDCLADGSVWGECLPTPFRRAAVMELSVAQCPLPNSVFTVPVPVLPSLTVQYSDGSPLVNNAVSVGERIRALLELPDAFQGHVDPFLVDVSVCSPAPHHRHRECVTNAQQRDCPFRGCRGWDATDSPLLFSRLYMADSRITARGVADNVLFCREEEHLYDDGCHAGWCGWSDRDGQGVLGGGDGASFVVEDTEGQPIIIDISVRLEKCDQDGEQKQIKRHLGVLNTVVYST